MVAYKKMPPCNLSNNGCNPPYQRLQSVFSAVTTVLISSYNWSLSAVTTVLISNYNWEKHTSPYVKNRRIYDTTVIKIPMSQLRCDSNSDDPDLYIIYRQYIRTKK